MAFTLVYAADMRNDTAVGAQKDEKASIDHIAMNDLLATINRLFLLGQYKRMERPIQQFTNKFPLVKEIFYFKAVASIHEKKYDEALAHLYTGLAIDPVYSRARNAAGYVYVLNGQWHKGLSYFMNAYSNNMYNAFIQYNIAAVHYQCLDFHTSALWSSNAVELKPNFGHAYYVYALSLHHLKEYAKAIKLYTQAMPLGIDDAGVYYNRALAHFALNDYDETIADCRAALRKDKNNYYAAMLLGYVHFTLKEYKKALWGFNAAASINKTDVFARVFAAECMIRGADADPKEAFRKVLGDIPNIEKVAGQILYDFKLHIIEPDIEFFLY